MLCARKTVTLIILLCCVCYYFSLLPWSAPNSENPVSVAGFYHVSAIERWRSIFDEQISLLLSSGLLAKTSSLTLTIMGSGDEVKEELASLVNSSMSRKIHIGHEEPYTEYNSWEFPALRQAHMFCLQHPDHFIYYMHTKGVIPYDSDTLLLQDQWRRYLQFFLVETHTDCITQLQDGADACGVDYKTQPFYHFPGNFWWARCDYVRSLMPPDTWRFGSNSLLGLQDLPMLQNGSRFRAEAWVAHSSGAARPPHIVSCIKFWRYADTPAHEYRHWTCRGPRVRKYLGALFEWWRLDSKLFGPAALVFLGVYIALKDSTLLARLTRALRCRTQRRTCARMHA